MNAVWVRLRADARRRGRAWLGAVLLTGLFAGIVTAAGETQAGLWGSLLPAALHVGHW